MEKQIEIIFNKDGTTEIKVNGVKGGSCKDITKLLEKSLGNVISDKKTNEYYQEEEENKNTVKI